MSSRDAAYEALLAALQPLVKTGVVRTLSRRLRLPSDVDAAERPALFLSVDHQSVQQTGVLPRRQLGAKLVLYVSAPDDHVPASVQLNGLIDVIEQLLQPPPGQPFQTLGGVVARAIIDGRIEIYEGLLSIDAGAVLPVTLTMP